MTWNFDDEDANVRWEQQRWITGARERLVTVSTGQGLFMNYQGKIADSELSSNLVCPGSLRNYRDGR